MLVHLVSPDEVAAIFVEPIQGEGGYVVPRAGSSIQRLRELTTKHGILLIADEVQSGMGRTGKMFAIEHFGVEPDIVTIAKGIASGLPLGVTTARAEVMAWPPGRHASTFGGNPVSCAAALATIELLRDVADGERGGGRRAIMLDRLRELQDEAPDHRRRARPRADDRHRAGARSHDQGARDDGARRRSSTRASSAACWCSAPAERRPPLAAAGADEGAGRHGGADPRTRRCRQSSGGIRPRRSVSQACG